MEMSSFTKSNFIIIIIIIIIKAYQKYLREEFPWHNG